MSTAELVPLAASDYELAAVAERSRFAPIMDVAFAMQRRETIKGAFTKLMEEGQDFGKVPGTGSKPTLLQPGAQKLDNLFGLVPRFPMELMRIEEDWTGERHGGEPFFRYMVVCQLMRGEFVMGEAIGECNSWESKYRYRTAERKCPTCGAASIIKTKKGTWWCAKFKGGCNAGFGITDARITGQETGRKTNPEIFDQINTLLKMAQKRSHVGATINATSASEFFTQDLEDTRDVETESPQGDQGNEAVAGNAAPGSSSPGLNTRPVPEELKLWVDNIINAKEQRPKYIGEAFVMLERAMVAAYNRLGDGKAAEGLAQYKKLVGDFRAKHPKGGKETSATLQHYIDLILDIWEDVTAANAAADAQQRPFQATDADLPEILQEAK